VEGQLSRIDQRETVATARRSSGVPATPPNCVSPLGGSFFRFGEAVSGSAPRILWPEWVPDGLTLAVYRAKPLVGRDHGPTDR